MDRLPSVRGFPDQSHIGLDRDQPGDSLADQRMIIDRQNPDRTGVAAHGSLCALSRENFLANQERHVEAEVA